MSDVATLESSPDKLLLNTRALEGKRSAARLELFVLRKSPRLWRIVCLLFLCMTHWSKSPHVALVLTMQRVREEQRKLAELLSCIENIRSAMESTPNHSSLGPPRTPTPDPAGRN
jgi:hypothetical protein